MCAVEEVCNKCDILQKNIPVEVIVDYVRQICNGKSHNKNIVHGIASEKYGVDEYNHNTMLI